MFAPILFTLVLQSSRWSFTPMVQVTPSFHRLCYIHIVEYTSINIFHEAPTLRFNLVVIITIMVQNLISNPDLSSILFDSIKCKLFRDSVELFIQHNFVDHSCSGINQVCYQGDHLFIVFLLAKHYWTLEDLVLKQKDGS